MQLLVHLHNPIVHFLLQARCCKIQCRTLICINFMYVCRVCVLMHKDIVTLIAVYVIYWFYLVYYRRSLLTKALIVRFFSLQSPIEISYTDMFSAEAISLQEQTFSVFTSIFSDISDTSGVSQAGMLKCICTSTFLTIRKLLL